MQAYTIGLSINKDPKLEARERKGEEQKYRLKIYTILRSRDCNLPQSASTRDTSTVAFSKENYIGGSII